MVVLPCTDTPPPVAETEKKCMLVQDERLELLFVEIDDVCPDLAGLLKS